MPDSLLPHNATAQERALEAAVGPPLFPKAPLREIWDPDRCPAELLPWLAFAMSVDEWDPEWEEATKRQVIHQSFQVHQRKGTVGAVKQALAAIGTSAEIVEWFKDGAPPHTFKVWVDLRAVLRAGADLPSELAKLGRAIDAAKPVRSHYTAHAKLAVENKSFSGATSRLSGHLKNRPGIPDAPRVATHMTAGLSVRAVGHIKTPVLEAA
jgi:phage tail P2-like protein